MGIAFPLNHYDYGCGSPYCELCSAGIEREKAKKHTAKIG